MSTEKIYLHRGEINAVKERGLNGIGKLENLFPLKKCDQCKPSNSHNALVFTTNMSKEVAGLFLFFFFVLFLFFVFCFFCFFFFFFVFGCFFKLIQYWQVHDLYCDIHKTIVLDGSHLGLLYKSKYSLFTYELMMSIMSHLCVGETFHQFYITIVDSYSLTGSTPPSLSLLREAWSGFLELIQYDKSTCPKCKDNPKTIICDGITLSCRKDELPLEIPHTEEVNIGR